MAPLRTLTDAYQRAAEEEAGNMTYHYRTTRPDGSPSTETVQVIRDPPSPLSMRQSRRRAQNPERQSFLDQLVAAERDTTANKPHRVSISESENSVSVLENATDDSIGRALLRNARDERLLGNLKNGTRIFSRARQRERPSLTAENLQRGNRSDSTVLPAQGAGSEGTGSSGSSNLPVNIPREWGRKARKQPDWLKRIQLNDIQPRLSPSPDIETPADSGATSTQKPLKNTRAGPEIDWLAVANEEAAPSEEASPRLPQQNAQQWSPPRQRRNPALDRIREWEVEEEFTASSLQISTSPPLKGLNKSLSDIREMEEEAEEARKEESAREESPAEASPIEPPKRISEKKSPKSVKEQAAQDQLRSPGRTSLPPSRSPEYKARTSPVPKAKVANKENQKPAQEAKLPKMDPSPQISSNHGEDSTLKKLEPSPRKQGEASLLFDGLEGKGVAIPDTPVIVYHNQRDSGSTDKTWNKRADSKAEVKPKQPEDDFTDSQELLRRLSRIASASPSPRREDVLQKKPAEHKASKPQSHLSPPTVKQPATQKADIAPKSESPLDSLPRLPTPPNAILSKHEDRKDQLNGLNVTPLPKQNLLPAKTPIVTGAWIETPAPAPKPRPESHPKDSVPKIIKSEPTSHPSRAIKKEDSAEPKPSAPSAQESKQEDPTSTKLEYQGPPLPRSALSSIIQRAKRKQEKNKSDDAAATNSSSAAATGDRPGSRSGSGSGSSDEDQLRLGDSTIDSLEDLMATTMTMHDSTHLTGLTEDDRNAIEAELDMIEKDEHGRPFTKAERERQQEMLAYERMNRRLRSLGTSIRDAKRGIEGLEHKFDSGTAPPPCKVCGCTAALPSSGGGTGKRLHYDDCNKWHIFAWPFPTVYQWPSDSRRPRLTWFGLFWVLFWAYVISEITINELWGHKFYTSIPFEGYGVDINAPRPPFATFKYLFKPIQFAFRPFIALCMELYGIG
ncbi:hypothetical protein L228DRAFT_260667 [Xylona heveae TC161]|uniref:Uncharacterized protein n=1 Tax=Xylona heveae (strain CBS 132557 / TC161) TaxID=1328760 RepID=A0A165GQU4_XYLHT|nr:hypothetical protein L228DRAFT_260667 [Xylona heveae TC161]KZF22480.1 hypothetical protein L228DRAFT_260667 [Xylona heveae TC161]